METCISAEILQQLSLLNSPYHTLVKSTVLALVKNVWCRSWVQEDLRDTMVNWGVIPTLIMTLLPAAPDLDVQKGCAYTSLIGFLADDDKEHPVFPTNLKLLQPKPTASSSMASQGHGNKLIVSTSPKSDSGGGGGGTGSLPKGQCLCSPTTHEGSFRCRLHRGHTASPANWMKRSKSMPANKPVVSDSTC
ncbi:hypothetical protein GmHk_07G018803 [Glycine max]|nr:hypothetical protein GmHk_07G018803 [Glycine max]